ncbi:MAG: hypothetical protein AAFW89_12090 [Bacteroidota bacterium]
MRISLTIFVLVFLFSCRHSPEKKLQSLKDEWVKADTSLPDLEQLEIRYRKALDYMETHRAYWATPLDDCTEIWTDTLRKNRADYRIALSPVNSRGVDNDISSTLDQLWACKVFKQPFDSLITRFSPTHGKYSDKNNMLVTYSNETINEVAEWRKKNTEKLKLLTSSILKDLPSNEESNLPVLFEVPTGKTIRVHIPWPAPNLVADWDSLKYEPNQILFDTWSDRYAIIFFNEKNEIDYVWWSGWER